MTDVADALAFWGVAAVIAALALPLAFRLFRRFPDGGAGLSFSLGLTLVATGYFLLRVMGTLPAGRGGLLLAIALFALVMVAVAARDRRFRATLRRSLPGMAVAAALFTALFFGYAFFRAHTPDIAHTEQPMDLLYLNAMLVSPEYPPHDPWFAGERASYYYGGYLQAAVLTGAADVWPATGYNLSLAAVFASAGTAAASLCAALARWLLGRRARRWVALAAAGGVTMLLFAGPLASAFELAAAHGADHQGVYEAFGVEGLARCGPGPPGPCTGQPLADAATWYPEDHWAWWRMSRMSYWGPQPGYTDVITEVPAFSFLLGDLHPHVMAIPGALLALAVSAVIWRGRGALSWREHRRRPWMLVAVALVFGSLAFVNTWDVMPLSLALGAAVFARNLRALLPLPAVSAAASWLIPPALLAMVAWSPWIAGLSASSVEGLYAYSGAGTRIRHVALLWGAGVVFTLPALGWAFRRRLPVPAGPFAIAAAAPVLPFLLWLALVAGGRTAGVFSEGDGFGTAFANRGAEGWLTLAFLALALWLLTAATLALARRAHAAAPLTGIAALALLLLYGAELLFIRDALFFVPRHNTVFKLSYQAWLLISVVSPVALVGAFRFAAPRARPLAAVPVAVLLGGALVFAVTMTPNRAGGFAEPVSLDGLHYVGVQHPGEYALVRWLGANVSPEAVVAEASGRVWRMGAEGRAVLEDPGGYGSFGRVGVRTGLQTPIGWPGHERTWRGKGASAEIDRRRDRVDRVYTAASREEALGALRELGATYVVVGREERERYRGGLIPPFEAFLDTVFAEGEARVFRVPVLEAVATR